MKDEKEKMFRTLTKKEVRKLKGGYYEAPDVPVNDLPSLIKQILEEMRGGWICR